MTAGAVPLRVWEQGRFVIGTSAGSLSAASTTAPAVGDKPGFRTKTIATRITPEELREVEAVAERDGKSMSEWLRDLALRAARERPAAPTELLLEELAALRYIVLNVFDATAQASQQNETLAPGSVLRIRDAADSRKRASAQKLLAEFEAGRG